MNKIGFKTDNKDVWSKTTVTAAKITVPTDTVDKSKMAFVFFDQKTLNGLTDECIDDAGGDEFQVGYRALRIRLKKGNFEVAMFFPTAFYNFDQEVGPSSVDYDLQDLEKEALACKPISLENTNSLISQLPIFEILKGHGYEVRFQEGDYGSIHRHPGRFGFSSVDTRKNPKDPGVIYRQVEAEDHWQADSVMYIHDKKSHTEIYTTECRIVNVKPHSDGGIEGTYCEIPTVTIIKPEDFTAATITDAVEDVMGSIEKDIFDQYIIKGGVKKYPLFKAILDMYKDVNVLADIANVDTKRIESKAQSWHKQGFGKGYYGGYGSYYGGYNKAKIHPESKTKIGITNEIVHLCPFPMTEVEDEYLRGLIGILPFHELRRLFNTVSEMEEEMEEMSYYGDRTNAFLDGYDYSMADYY